MKVHEIRAAVDRGEKVYWASMGYEVIKDQIGQYLIHCTMNDHYIGLTHIDDITLNGDESEFFII